MLLFLEEAATTTADTGAAGMLMTFLPLIAIFVVFYFMLIRPEKKRKKEAEQMRSALKNGDEITTIGGITVKVVDVQEDKFVIETGADQVRIEFAKWALSTHNTDPAPARAEDRMAPPAHPTPADSTLAHPTERHILATTP